MRNVSRLFDRPLKSRDWRALFAQAVLWYNTHMIDSKMYVYTDEHGVMRVARTRVMLDSVIASYLEGHAPEAIRQQYPALSLEEVHGAIAFYQANRDAVHEYLDRQEKLWNELRQKSGQDASPLVQRLRALRTSPARQAEQ